ncbi:cyclic nucleotide-binding domain-containing protein [Motiliproteus sediminis]|uniref:cyclic nucleotide-binding domain-containing protein n=1 Tax=Motiliproteus sediminis TaxID=1468178 RepID=UPI001AF00531|nr:Crp/Fnr family transcriptional regulator [Motiliproteus sediminis]
MDLAQEVERLRKIPMLSKVETSKLKLLAFTSQLLHYHDGEALFHLKDPADSVYLVMSGEVEILTESECGTLNSIVRGEGALIGEMAVISKTGRSATVRAKGGASVLKIEDDAFLQLLSGNPEVALDVMRQLSDKLAEAHQANEALQKQLRLGPTGE